jgi:hypothetical protein
MQLLGEICLCSDRGEDRNCRTVLASREVEHCIDLVGAYISVDSSEQEAAGCGERLSEPASRESAAEPPPDLSYTDRISRRY